MNNIVKKPNKKANNFVAQAGSELVEGKTKRLRAKKKQIPVMIPENLLDSLDEHIEASMMGLSRSAWICQSIKEKLDNEL